MHGTSMLRFSLSKQTSGACHAYSQYRSASRGSLLGGFARQACGGVSAGGGCGGAGSRVESLGDCAGHAFGNQLPASDQERKLKGPGSFAGSVLQNTGHGLSIPWSGRQPGRLQLEFTHHCRLPEIVVFRWGLSLRSTVVTQPSDNRPRRSGDRTQTRPGCARAS